MITDVLTLARSGQPVSRSDEPPGSLMMTLLPSGVFTVCLIKPFSLTCKTVVLTSDDTSVIVAGAGCVVLMAVHSEAKEELWLKRKMTHNKSDGYLFIFFYSLMQVNIFLDENEEKL